MATVNDVYEALQNLGAKITKKGGVINTSSPNPSINDLGNGIDSIQVNQFNVNEPASNVSNIIVAEVSGITISVMEINGSVIDTKTTPTPYGGVLSFAVTDIGNYFVRAIKDGSEYWVKTVGVTNLGSNFFTKPARVDNHTFGVEDIYNAKNGNFTKYFCSVADYFVYSDPDSIFNNLPIAIEHIFDDGSVGFRLKEGYTAASYKINDQHSYLTSATGSFTTSSGYSNKGGYKYSDARQKFMRKGDTVYSQIGGLKPVGGTQSTGIAIDQITYSDTLQTTPALDLDLDTETFTPTTDAVFTNSNDFQDRIKFVKGYFKQVGTLTQEQFNAGYFYTFSNYTYTHSTTYSSSTSYYGFYEFLQEDGIFYAALNKVAQYLSPMNEGAGCGGAANNVLYTYTDYVDIPCLENYVGYHKTTDKYYGGQTGNSFNYSCPVSEGIKYDLYKDPTYYAIARDQWSRTSYTGFRTSFVYVNSVGYLGNGNVYNTYYLRPGFRV